MTTPLPFGSLAASWRSRLALATREPYQLCLKVLRYLLGRYEGEASRIPVPIDRPIPATVDVVEFPTLRSERTLERMRDLLRQISLAAH